MTRRPLGDATTPPPPAPPQARVDELEERAAELEAREKESKEAMLRLLADMENLRSRTARQMEDTKKFATQKLAKDILDVADNLERALGAVPAEVRDKAGAVEGTDYYAQLCSLSEGVGMVRSTLQGVLGGNGMVRFDPKGQKFDPHTMSALFEFPNPAAKNKEVVEVVKVGYSLNGRVIRPAEVGVATGGEEFPEEEAEDAGEADGEEMK